MSLVCDNDEISDDDDEEMESGFKIDTKLDEQIELENTEITNQISFGFNYKKSTRRGEIISVVTYQKQHNFEEIRHHRSWNGVFVPILGSKTRCKTLLEMVEKIVLLKMSMRKEQQHFFQKFVQPQMTRF